MAIKVKTVFSGMKSMVALGVCGMLVACGGGGEPAQARLPISINEVMASLINHAADPIWAAAWRNPQTEREWRELEHLARQLQVGGALLAIPGRGPLDEEWTSNSDWGGYAADLSAAAGRAVDAARGRNAQQVAAAGDQIVEICEGCHIDFKPDLPTMNIYGELSPLPSDPNR